MSALKDGRVPFELDKTRYLLFDLNAVDAVTDKYGSFENLGDVIDPTSNHQYMKDLRYLVALMINEGAPEGEPELTEKQVGKLINMSNMVAAMNAVTAAISFGESGTVQHEHKESGEENPQIAATSTM